MANEEIVDATTQNSDAGGEQENSEVTHEDANLDVKTLKEQNRQLFERAKKAESLAKELRAKAPKEEAKSEAKAESNEPNYGRLAYLKAVGVENPDDIKIVEDEANRLKLPLTDVLGMEHIKSRLQVNKDARNAQNGMPNGSNRTGGNTQHDVDYWLAKGGLPLDNQSLAEKVVKARMGSDSSQRKFDPID